MKAGDVDVPVKVVPSRRSFTPGRAYVGLHVFAFNVCQLYVFRRYGFFAMYTTRLVYYAIWHIIWGHLRLELLF